MSNTGCGQVSKPVLDETFDKCSSFNYSTCIEVDQICRKVGNLKGENLSQFLDKLCQKLSKIDNELFRLEQENTVLKNRVSILEGNI